ncbi:hypothetical protein VHEMI09893 [[Torrubiella] hemipterigena]|nr:hypothetical protein VHEMI09893 [[Torrubiella] hemipterigena]
MIWNIEDYNQPPDWTTKYTWEENVNQQLIRLPTTGPGRFKDNLWYEVFDQPGAQALFTTPFSTVGSRINNTCYQKVRGCGKSSLFSSSSMVGTALVKYTEYILYSLPFPVSSTSFSFLGHFQ